MQEPDGSRARHQPERGAGRCGPSSPQVCGTMQQTQTLVAADMDIAEIEVFLTVAEELHFGRTAERLRLPQPQVSRLIVRLERRAGGPLFDRTTRRVRLTPLGNQLRIQLEPAYRQITMALETARTASRGVTGVLRVGGSVTAPGPALTHLVEEFCDCYSDCELILHTVTTKDPYTPLRHGDIDVLLSYLALDEPDLTAGPVIEYRDRALAVCRGHRLAHQESVSVEDLGGEEVHENAAPFPEALYDAIVPRFTPSGRPIRRTYPWRTDEDVLTAVARGRIVHPVMSGVALFTRPDFALVPIRDLPPMPLGLIWCTAHENARIRAFAAIARLLAISGGRRDVS
jgi:DNA-binding transcriptional LysR family regulator